MHEGAGRGVRKERREEKGSGRREAENVRRSARLKLHAVHDKLKGERVSMLGDERPDELALRVELSEGGIVVVGLTRVDRREQLGREAVLGDQVLSHDEQELGPDLADRVDAKVWL